MYSVVVILLVVSVLSFFCAVLTCCATRRIMKKLKADRKYDDKQGNVIPLALSEEEHVDLPTNCSLYPDDEGDDSEK